MGEGEVSLCSLSIIWDSLTSWTQQVKFTPLTSGSIRHLEREEWKDLVNGSGREREEEERRED